MVSPINGKSGTNPPHVNVTRVPMPRTPGLHSPARPASGKTRADLQAIDPHNAFGASPKKRARRAPLAPTSNTSTACDYQGAKLRAAVRPGADDFLTLPSRMGNRLRYRDGRLTDMQGNPITNHP